MRLSKLHVRNFCQHRDLEVEFPPGVTGILGGNGQGKSNLMKAVRFALIGESGNVGVKTEDLNWYAAKEGESGFVELTFEVGGVTGTLKRFVSSTRTSLKHAGVSTTSASKATARMLDISGVTEGTIKDIIFVGQGKIETILFEKPAERAKKFQRLFGTEGAEKLRQLLHQEVAMLTTDPVDDRIKELETQLATDVDPQLRALNNQSEQMKAELERHDFDAYENLVKAFEASQTATEQLADLFQQKQRCENGVDPALFDKLAAEVQKLSDEISAKRVTVTAARAQLVNVQGARALVTTKKRLKADIAEYERKLKQPPPTPPAVDEKQLEDSKKQVDMARAEVARHTHFIKTFEQGRPMCPTCNQPVQNALARVEESRKIVEAREAIIQQIEQMMELARADVSTYNAKLFGYKTEIEACKELIEKNKKELAGLPEAMQLHGDEEALQQQIAAFEQLEQRLNSKSVEFNELKEQGAKSAGELSSIERQIEHTQKQIRNDITPEQYSQAKTMMEQIGQAQLALAEVAGQLKQLQSTRIRVLAELEGLRAQAGSLASKRKYKMLCTRTRELLHRDVLPRRVTQRYLSMLNTALGEHLSLFNVPFSCNIDDSLNVTCSFPGVEPKPAERLSGGQMMMLGIAFRFAICKLFAAKLGFVVLDEPSAMIDDDHIEDVVTMLNTVRGHALRAGLQLLVITHKPPLAATFDSTIRL